MEAESIFWVTPTNEVFLVRNETGDWGSCQPTAQILANACGQVYLTNNYLFSYLGYIFKNFVFEVKVKIYKAPIQPKSSLSDFDIFEVLSCLVLCPVKSTHETY